MTAAERTQQPAHIKEVTGVMASYHIFWSDEDQGFIAVAPDLPGCSAFGRTREEAADEFRHAVAAWTEAQKLAGNIIAAQQPLDQGFARLVNENFWDLF